MKLLLSLLFFLLSLSHASDIFHEKGIFETSGFGCDTNGMIFIPSNSQFNHKLSHKLFTFRMSNRECILMVAKFMKNEVIELDVVRNETFDIRQESVSRKERYCRFIGGGHDGPRLVCTDRTINETRDVTYLEEWIGIDVGGGNFYLQSKERARINH